MDYAAQQEDNLQPGKSNFDLLVKIYGSVNSGDNATTNAMDQSPPQYLRAQTDIVDTSVPESVADQYFQAAKELESTTCLDCAIDLGEGYRIMAHKLHVFDG